MTDQHRLSNPHGFGAIRDIQNIFNSHSRTGPGVPTTHNWWWNKNVQPTPHTNQYRVGNFKDVGKTK